MSHPCLPLLIEPDQLPAPLNPTAYCLVDLRKLEEYQAGHIAGAVPVVPAEITSAPPIPGLLPAQERLEQLFGRLGHHPELHYIVYDGEGGGWAGRFIWLLDSIGHSHYSYLNGGLQAWIAEGKPLVSTLETPEPTQPQINLNHEHTIDLATLVREQQSSDRVIWDARSPEEHRGEKVLAARGGHIPGAINFEWTAGMDPQRGLRLRTDLADKLAELGITPDKEVVTHCQTHHRSGFTYLAAKILGYPRVKAYAGSWSEWGNHPNAPIES